MEVSFSEMDREKYIRDIDAVKWFAQELIDGSYTGVSNLFLMRMESDYRSAFRTIIGYTDNYGRYIDGYLDAPFWNCVEEALISCANEYREASLRHPKNSFYPAVVDACDTILEYLSAGLPM